MNPAKYIVKEENQVRFGQARAVVGYTYGPNGIGVTFHVCTITIKPKS